MDHEALMCNSEVNMTWGQFYHVAMRNGSRDLLRARVMFSDANEEVQRAFRALAVLAFVTQFGYLAAKRDLGPLKVRIGLADARDLLRN